MIVKCPSCEAKYKLDPAKLSSPEPKIRCKKCGNVFKAVDEAAARPAAPAAPPAPPPTPPAAPASAAPAPTPAPSPAPAPAPAAGGSPVVVVAHESPEVTGMVEELLGEAGYSVVRAHDGVHALMEIEQRRPAVAILDVALPKMFGFEVVEVVRRDKALDTTKLLLIAAIYDKTRYKRSPVNLYGADDYVEKHQIPETVVDKVKGLIGDAPAVAPVAAPAAAAPAPVPTPAPTPAAAPAAAPVPASTPTASAGAFDESSLTPQEKEDHEKAKRLARIIVSDVALYNPEALVEGLKQGNALEALSGDIEEGRKLFHQRVPASVRDKFDYLAHALEDLFEKKRKELGLAS